MGTEEFLTPSYLLAFAQVFAAAVTAGATIVLVIVTRNLSTETRRLAESTARAHVTVTFEPNDWSMTHLDLVVQNSGNAAAYDVKVEVAHPLPPGPARGEQPIPFQEISLIRPGQTLSSYVTEWKSVEHQKIAISVSWAAAPDAKVRETLKYSYDMDAFEGMTRLGASSPLVGIAEQLKKVREDWRSVAIGQRRLNIDTFSQDDRDKMRAAIEEERAVREAQKNEDL